MMEHESAKTLLEVICILAATAALSWTMMAGPMRVAPGASKRFAMANTCVLIGILLYSGRSEEPSYLYWWLAELIILSGFCTLRHGVQRLYRLKSSLKFDIGLVVITAILMSFVSPQESNAVYLVAVLSVAASISFLLLARDHYYAFKNTFTAFATYWLVIPLAMIGLLFLFRAIALAIYPEYVDALATLNTQEAKPVLWIYILLILLVNILIIGNSISKLVTKILTLANQDPLTSTWNRNFFPKKLQQIHDAWLLTNQPYSLLLIDLDHFKSINDAYGHIVGDDVLKHCAKTLSDVIGKDDFLCRYGGEEFLIMLPKATIANADVIAQRCLSALTCNPFITDKYTITVTASIGCASVVKDMPASTVLLKADKAMYEAKNASRNCIRIAS